MQIRIYLLTTGSLILFLSAIFAIYTTRMLHRTSVLPTDVSITYWAVEMSQSSVLGQAPFHILRDHSQTTVVFLLICRFPHSFQNYEYNVCLLHLTACCILAIQN